MSQEPKVTRFGADPTVDQELATKAYVDNSSGGSTLTNYWLNMTNNAWNTGRFNIWGLSSGTITTETERQSVCVRAETQSLLCIFLHSNSVATITTWVLRINAATVNQVVSVAASATGFFQDITNTDVVAAGDLMSLLRDDGGATTQGVAGMSMIGTSI